MFLDNSLSLLPAGLSSPASRVWLTLSGGALSLHCPPADTGGDGGEGGGEKPGGVKGGGWERGGWGGKGGKRGGWERVGGWGGGGKGGGWERGGGGEGREVGVIMLLFFTLDWL